MTREEAAKIIEKQFDESCGDYRYQNKDKLDYEDALWLAIAALRQRKNLCHHVINQIVAMVNVRIKFMVQTMMNRLSVARLVHCAILTK